MRFSNPIWKVIFQIRFEKWWLQKNAYTIGSLKFSDENLNPIPTNKRSNPCGIRRAYTKFEPESEHECVRIRRAYTNPNRTWTSFRTLKSNYSIVFLNENMIRTRIRIRIQIQIRIFGRTESELKHFSNQFWKLCVLLDYQQQIIFR